MTERRPNPDDRPSDAVLDELLRAFEADDLSLGADVDLDSPEVEELLSGEQGRPDTSAPSTDAATPSTDAGDADGADDQETPPRDLDDDEGVVRVIPVTNGTDPGDDRSGQSDESTGAETDSDDEAHDAADDAEAAGEAAAAVHDHQAATHGSPAIAGEPSVVIIDADDGGDDPIYVDGNLAPDAGGGAEASGTVFIDDDAMDVADAVGSAEAARVTGIEPKLRERRVAVQRAEGRKRLRWVVLAAGVIVVLVAGLVVLGSSLFTIGDVEVEGAAASEGETLDQIVDELGDENVWGVDLSSYRRRIERIPAVGNVRISKGFFGGATIEIDEREATAAFAGDDGRFRVIDNEGRVLRIADQRPSELPLVDTIDGEEPPNTEPGSFADPGFGNAGAYASMLTPAVMERLEVISVARDGSETRLHLQGGTEVLVGDGADPVGKLARLENEIVRYEGDLPARLDVSTDEVTNVPG